MLCPPSTGGKQWEVYLTDSPYSRSLHLVLVGVRMWPLGP
jgi:hypothetical protein